MWEVRPAPLTGGRQERRDFELRNRERPQMASLRIIISMPWSGRLADGPQTEQCAETLFRIAQEIAAQDALPIRR
jgi:hypothetical protein